MRCGYGAYSGETGILMLKKMLKKWTQKIRDSRSYRLKRAPAISFPFCLPSCIPPKSPSLQCNSHQQKFKKKAHKSSLTVIFVCCAVGIIIGCSYDSIVWLPLLCHCVWGEGGEGVFGWGRHITPGSSSNRKPLVMMLMKLWWDPLTTSHKMPFSQLSSGH